MIINNEFKIKETFCTLKLGEDFNENVFDFWEDDTYLFNDNTILVKFINFL